jgi:hypothetical protein
MTEPFLGIDPGGRYVVVPEEKILRYIVFRCWPFQAQAGEWDWALNQAANALERWIGLGLPYHLEGGRRIFDFCQVSNFALWSSQTFGDPVYEEVVQNSRREASALLQDCASGDTSFRLELRREFSLEECPPSRVVRLRVPLPLEGDGCRVAEARLVEPASPAVRQTRIPGRLELQLQGANLPAWVAIEVHVRFRAWATSPIVEPDRLEGWDKSSPEYELYTRRDEPRLPITESVAQLAESLAGSCRSPWQAVGAFWRFFFEKMRPGFLHHDELDEDDPLGSLVRRGWFDCYAGSSLMAALCRARGIPARLKSGFTLYPVRPTFHYWLEVLLPPNGWVPFDLSNWTLAGGKPDEVPWGSFYRGRLDPRMTVECPPRLTLGSPGVRFPRSWYMVQDLSSAGTEMTFHSLATRQVLYRDCIRVCRETNPEGANAVNPGCQPQLTRANAQTRRSVD